MSATEDYLVRVLTLLASVDRRLVGWRCDGAYAPVTFFIDATGLFDWSSSVVVPLARHDVGELERAIADVRGAAGADVSVGVLLYAARTCVRRPMGARYPRDRRLWGLFDSAGSERPEDDSVRPGTAWQGSRGRHCLGPVTGEYPAWDDATSVHPIAGSASVEAA